MDLFDEFSKSLAESVPRRESLRRLGAVFAGAALSQLGLGTAWAGRRDPCNAFCKCRTKARQRQCLAACRACNGDTSRLGGSCGSYVCCSITSCRGVCSDLKSDPNCGACGNDCDAVGLTCCGGSCVDLDNDFDHCGACDVICDVPGPYEYGACVEGACVYGCVEGATICMGACTNLSSDPDNCGACGNVCTEPTPYCNGGKCSECAPGDTLCDGICTDLVFDNANCGACGVVCPNGWSCQGVCTPIDY
ncbi:MAG: hypothetical protein ACYC4U_14050 [Pirellulaceae bacterium]